MLDFDETSTYELLLRICSLYQTEPSSSLEAEDFFRKLLRQYTGSPDQTSIAAWLTDQIAKHFVALGERPRWVQGAKWAFSSGQPMIFAGQIDLTQQEREKVTPPLYHDDTALYVFVGRGVKSVIVVQQF